MASQARPVSAETTSVNSQQNIPEVSKKQSSIYQIAAKKVVQSAPLLIMTTVALTAMASLPTVLATPCDDTYSICRRYCMSNAGDPQGTGACFVGCQLAYWACKGTSMAFGLGW